MISPHQIAMMSAARVFELSHGKGHPYPVKGQAMNVARAMERSGLGQVVTIAGSSRKGVVLSEEGRRVVVAMGQIMALGATPTSRIITAGEQLAKVADVLAGGEPTARHAIEEWNRAVASR